MKADGVLESLQRPALDMAAPERDVEAPERRLRVDALQVVALAEQRLVAASHGGLRIALSARDGAKAVKPSRDGGDEPPLALHIGGDGAEQRRRGLVRPVGAREALDGLVGPPARLKQVIDAALGAGAGEIGVVAAPGPARHAEGVGQELDDGLARREVDGEVVPFRGRDLDDAPFHQRLAGRDELDDGGAAGIEIGLDPRGCARRRPWMRRRQAKRHHRGRRGGGDRGDRLRFRLRDVRLGRVFRVIHRDHRSSPLRAVPAPSRFSDPKRIEVGTTGDAWESILAKPRQTSFRDQIISRVRGWCQV